VTTAPHVNNPPDRIQRDTRLDLTIDDLAYGGKGVARTDGFVVFVDHAVPGDHVMARVTRRKKNHAEAEIAEMIAPSLDRVEAPCPVFGTCGGCSWQNLSYERQLHYKQRLAESSLEHLGRARPDRLDPIIGSPLEYRYRNKMDFTFGRDAQGKPIVGFHLPERFSDILHVSCCLLAPEPVDRLLASLRAWLAPRNLNAYDPRSHRGFLRHLLVRYSSAANVFTAVLLTGEGELPEKESLVAALREACPEMQGFVWGTNRGQADLARMDSEQWRWGEPEIEERLGALRFRVSPLSFFQVNTRGAELLYGVVRDMLGDDARDQRLLDAYCGTGSIGLFCADLVREVVGVEVVRDAIWDARLNARNNGIDNCTFLAGDMREVLPLAAQTGSFGRVIMDPPRGGMDKRALAGLIAIGAPVMIYVSCNPTTLARDLMTIAEAGYRPTRMQPVDLFPQTFHIETVVRFESVGRH
jgi:23S rRNA (uracil1939-C5)-methyltransferase